MSRIGYALALLATAAALALAGCGGGNDGTSGTDTGGGPARSGYGGQPSGASESSASERAAAAKSAVVSTSSVEGLGTILVDSRGYTLYDFHKDKGTMSACYDACAQAWPPLITEEEPLAGGGAIGSKLSTTERKDGTVQVTYAGHPLYTYAQDEVPGQARGNDVSSFGAEWYALQPSGEEPED